MDMIQGHAGREAAITALFRDTFTASEGAEEGQVVAGLAHDLLARTPASDLRVFRAEAAGRVIGAAIFTPLVYPGQAPRVMLLSPMAVAADWQGRGVGQGMLRHALAALRAEGVAVALTYGDPAFYRRVGFVPVSAAEVPPPHVLSAPEGWLGQSLTGAAIPGLSGVPVCAAALDRADVW
ncbi:GNAT family N-acetyltransferase [Roseovarius ramblicola]|uniref:GNAT family N-acetyltransferase n=1 Tax=Roseovarius ramblicola TaxID=2022336 RepID=A0ABV5HW52_9RHOB